MKHRIVLKWKQTPTCIGEAIDHKLYYRIKEGLRDGVKVYVLSMAHTISRHEAGSFISIPFMELEKAYDMADLISENLMLCLNEIEEIVTLKATKGINLDHDQLSDYKEENDLY